MKKRLLALLLVLGMASGAGAALDIYLTDASGDSVIMLDVGNVVTLHLWYEGEGIIAFDTDLDPGPPDGNDSDYCTIISGTITATNRNPGSDVVGPGTTDITTGMELIAMSFGPALGQGLSEPLATIDVRRDTEGEGATIVLIDNVTYGMEATQVYPTMHGITINHVPEPMTITLLGLGGLLLRRRKNSI